MFTGIIESLGTLKKINQDGTNMDFYFESAISEELKVDQSVSHNGVCLTVTKLEGQGHWVTAVKETLSRSSLGSLSIGQNVNLERCMPANGRFDGHIVQGHVDTTAQVISVEDQKGSWLFRFKINERQGLMVDKGSITVDGTSLTCFDVTANEFSVAIIPFTYFHTNFQGLKNSMLVNIEFDIVGKYIQQIFRLNTK